MGDKMIKYPVLKSGATIGVTAPSSGLKEQFHELMKQSINRMERDGYKMVCEEVVWTLVANTFCYIAVVSSEYSPLKSIKFVPCAVAIPVFKVNASKIILVSEYPKIHFSM